ncbi:hypothetical protein FB565_005042 [Actinoplanes lutulentus]|uniref:Uncharacterized protein n=1 Tax=Actinoplanes lutulentus TaxID=1287878 RepID=A0A327ZHB8_9ACTN|nr:hypothetical protein [Actinoplanes lutulentus]MBB2945309.1 hypothetical protein [Actinoplanes lutulentus]RAK40556.1 hypothetical protein B0I29_103594 [Actinoplanes lutulentus]
MTDRFEELFADLRAETLPTVRPPGAATLRRAARRRQAALSSISAVVAVLMIAGLIGIVVRPGGGQSSFNQEAPEPEHYSQAVLAEKVAGFLNAGEEAMRSGKTFTYIGPEMVTSRHELLGGTYEMPVTCFGSGDVAVAVHTTAVGKSPISTTYDHPCVTQKLTTETLLTVPQPSGMVSVEVTGVGVEPGEAAFGYLLQLSQDDRIRYQKAAESVLPKQWHTMQSTFLDGADGAQLPVRPVEQVITVACVGFGSLTLTVGPVDENETFADRIDVPCTLTSPAKWELRYTPPGKSLRTTITPDRTAIGRSAAAVSIAEAG